jgi:hypothetical protein
VASGGRRAAVEQEEALRFFGWRWEMRRRGLTAASSQAAVADDVVVASAHGGDK